MERFLGDAALSEGWTLPPVEVDTGRRVLVIGAGPSGLSAAYHLRRFGHQVEVRDAGPKAGGMMRFGIPAYRLPRDVLDAELQRVFDAGVELTLNSRGDDVLTAKAAGNFDTGCLALGAHICKRKHMPAEASALPVWNSWCRSNRRKLRNPSCIVPDEPREPAIPVTW